ncbi:MAG: hypothetical protein VX000_13605, partial [Myxococcota bacterium]|nr:hypothetical protein [Myxococcota bacterium]
AARRAAEVVMNVRRILAIELLAAANALAFRREEEGDVLQLGAGTGPALATVEAALGGFSAMRAPSDDIAALDQLLQTDALFDGLPALLPVGAVPGDGA